MTDAILSLVTPLAGFIFWYWKYRRRVRWTEVEVRWSRGEPWYVGKSRRRRFTIVCGENADASIPWFVLKEDERRLARGSIAELMDVAERVNRTRTNV